ncbi:LysE family translocator [Oscillatoria sp. FACHB-1407]|uniref:LysE family translocator n=1 Tax=Oscillatoria sp. FACHB-1407 TaxID=2692847 RepID=UPI0016868EA9|nr:LysE family translocator [Oscillatoria sp. FACHB-1407]MBD2460540.1 LysE family translocator [Oscillatoria sp. FACHB-1407]
MPEATLFGLFLTAAIALAITPGPGIFYVLTRSLKGGRVEGLVSSAGTAVGGFVHVIAAAFGLSAILTTSATAFVVIKLAGAAYLVVLGIQTLMAPDHDLVDTDAPPTPMHFAFRQGIVTEILNPKTALFFLAFIPQFVNPQGNVVAQFILLGSISIALNTTADAIVALLAGPIGQWFRTHARFRRRQRLFTGWSLIGLGAYVAIADDNR